MLIIYVVEFIRFVWLIFIIGQAIKEKVFFLKIIYETFFLFMCLFIWVYGISTFVGYLMPNPFLYK